MPSSSEKKEDIRFLDDTQTIPSDTTSCGLQVIAAGQWRCATSSLQLAFEQILDPPLAPSMHGAYLMPHPEKIHKLNRATREKDKKKRQAILREIYTGYNASSDWPGFVFLNDLLDMYPDCKVILNKRKTPESWATSTQTSLAFFSTPLYALTTLLLPLPRAHHALYTHFKCLAAKRYGVPATTAGIFSKECYNRHNQWVHVTCAARGKQVLEWEPEDGWEPLCEFLGREVPKGREFPRMNEGEEIRKLKGVLVWQGLVAWGRLLGGIVLFVGLLWVLLLRLGWA
ncbi:hypothetical protein M409DRAFT_54794 [Zasmidium cellare ATCC 36951]|uniref:Uncharacterized protein n=1 Tax=Zasmidium cellare ATCC 36951 TaxID=1080233 RepID=A0A6A6CLY0_ZASCE|nr:uncharacterized protein M409DRAFT_54794 [Zasmidium cellare ATCC 36951]KAF2166446.1 hypothetical protein M409DRAFT_54794 [Zasmidium cellare ATCC 36951]